MTTELTQDSKPSFGVTFSKKVSDGNYGGEEVSFWVSADVAVTATDGDKLEALNAAAFIAKAAAFEQLGLEFENKDGILFAINTKRLQKVGLVDGNGQPAPVANAVEMSGTGSRTGTPLPNSDGRSAPSMIPVVKFFNAAERKYVAVNPQPELPSWFVEQAVKEGVTEVLDNRDKVATNPKAPWFKGFGANKDKAYWSPKK